MKKIIFGLYLLLVAGLTIFNAGCYAHINGRGIGVGIETTHDRRWHYDHDNNDEWRSHHAWHEERQDWD
jgi:hypothetical protein